MNRILSLGLLLAVLASVVACSSDDDDKPPVFDPISDRDVAVGSELAIALSASDPDGDAVSFKYKVDLGDISDRAALEKAAGGNAVFKWTPVASDLGPHAVDFIATDGKDDSRLTITVNVKPATGSATSPVFRQPLGTGTTLDLSVNNCVQVPIEIEDQDSSTVELGQDPPIIQGASLSQNSGLTGVWEWCPTPEQLDKELNKLILTANDQDNPKVIKEYLIVLQKPLKQDCPGQAPVVNHTPQDESTVVDLTIDATVSDDKGLKFAPLLYYSTTDPGPTPDVATMTQTTMVQIDGDLINGTWAADVPNPVASKAPGSSSPLYYVIAARDNDDEAGECDHLTKAPATGSYQMTVTNPGGSGSLAPCKSCTADVQCGGANDTCIFIGSGGKTYCGKACSSSAECPSGYDCSPSPVLSIDFDSSRQCVPSSQSCTGATTQCKDDQYEENDTLLDVKTAPGLPAGSYNLKSCPGPIFDDEDWYPIDISSETQVSATLAGGSASNLDLFLKDSTGTKIASSTTNGSNESITACLAPGRYYFHVWAWSQAENSYSLTWSKGGSCNAACVDDGYENDDQLSQARKVDLNSGTYKQSGNQNLFDGRRLVRSADVLRRDRVLDHQVRADHVQRGPGSVHLRFDGQAAERLHRDRPVGLRQPKRPKLHFQREDDLAHHHQRAVLRGGSRLGRR